MCKMRVVVRREMLGAREQAWSIWNGKEVMEYTGNQIKGMLKSGQMRRDFSQQTLWSIGIAETLLP